MKLHVVDILIICAYLIVIVLIGLFLKKKAAKNMDSYFLGGKSLPFYMLGLSNASGMFDITGTYHVDGLLGLCIWFQEFVDSLAVAGVQSDIPDGVSFRMVAPK